MLDAFRRLPLAAQIVVAAFVLTLIVHGGTKPTNGVPPSASSPATLDLQDDDEPSSGVFSLTELSDVQLAVGVVLAEVRTNEVHDFTVPENALVHIPWLKRGASADVFPLVLTNWCFRLGTNVHDRLYVSASGTISFGTPMASAVRASDDVDHLAPFHTTLGVVPEANWNLLATEDSGFWHAVSPSNTAVFTWSNVLFDRDTNFPVTVQAELSEDGDVVCRYDLSSLAGKTNWMDRASIGVWNNQTGEVYVAANHFPELDESASSPLPTTILFRHLLPTDTPTGDRDGDGLSTADELFVHRTDPDRIDTDCDGVSDYDEVLHGTNPRLVDTDGDGLVDGSDPDPLSETASADLDDDGIPDAYEDHWFGGTNAVDAANMRDGTGFTLADKMLGGVNPTNAAPAVDVAAANSLVSWRLFDAFVSDRATASTNLVWERTFAVNRANAWQQLFVSADPTNAAPWRLEGLALEWETDGGLTGTATASPRWDSFRIPLPADAAVSTLTLRLRVADGAGVVRAPRPLHLIVHAPEFRFTGGEKILGEDGVTYWVFLEGADSEVRLVVDNALRPSNAAVGADEGNLMDFANISLSNYDFFFDGDLSGGTVSVARPGICALPTAALDIPLAARGRAGRSPRGGGGGSWLVVLDPSASRSCGDHGCTLDGLGYDWEGDSYHEEDAYPLDSPCLRGKWHRDRRGGWMCDGGELVVSSGVREGDGSPVSVSGNSVLVGGVPVWSGDAEHARHGGECGDGYWEGFLGDACDGCDDDCPGGSCDNLEGPELGSLKFRIPLGVPGKGQLSGFVWFTAEEPVSVSKSTVQVLAHPSADVADETVSGVRRITCSDTRGRDLHVADIAGGIRVTIRETAAQTLVHTWEITNVGGDSSQVRFRKISRADNTLSDETFIHEHGDWERLDNVAGLRTRLETWGDISDPSDGVKYETRTTRDADGNFLSSVTTELSRLGDCDNALARETYREESTGWNTTWTRADYWNDPARSGRHGRPRLVWGNARAWVYTDFDDLGHTTLRVEQRGAAAVPEMFPYVVSNELFDVSTLADAHVIVYDYAPHVGDSCHDDDAPLPRTETKYIVRNGVATFAGRTWHRYVRLVRDGYAAVRHETRRATEPDATFNSPSNATSYEIVYADTGVGTLALMRNAVAESCDEDGLLTVNAYTLANGELSCETRRSGPSAFPTYETTVRDAVHGTLLRRTTRLASDDTVTADEQSLYDDRNRLRSTAYLDGTSLTNAYSCCRLLWKVDRAGRKTLRSAATGYDHLHYAEEDVWLADVSTNDAFRITRHYFDALGRETNVVVSLGTIPGEAVPPVGAGVPSVDPAQIITSETTTYPLGGSDYAVHVDARGRETVTRRDVLSDCIETCDAVFTNGVEVMRTKTRAYFGGGSSTRREWGGEKWSEERRFDDYLPDGRRVDYVVTESSDCGVVTNSISIHDFLGRLESAIVPGMNGSWIVTSNAYDGASSRLISSTQFAPGLEPRTTVYLYNACGEQVGTVFDGVTNRTDVAYATISNEVWRIETSTIVGASTNAVSVTRTRLTGLSDVCRSHVTTRNGTTGVETETCTAFDPKTKIETTTATSSTTTPTVRRSQYGLTLSSETSEATTHNAYDGLGRVVHVTRETDELGIQPVQGFVYAPCGDLVTTLTYTNATDAVVESYAYDAFGNRVEETDALGNSTCRSYDPFGRVTEEGGAAYPVRYAYDTAGRRTSLATTRDGSTWDVTTWTYDAATGFCLSKTYADGTATTYTYTADGLPLRTTYASGKWRECVYDTRRNLAGMVYSSSDMACEIQNDEFGRAVSVVDAAGNGWRYAYAEGSVLTNEVQEVNGWTNVFVRHVDAFRRSAGYALSVNGTAKSGVGYGYDAEGRIASLSATNAEGRVFSVAYTNWNGQCYGYALTTPTGGTLRRDVARDAYRASLATACDTLFGETLTASYRYVYDAAGRPIMRNADIFRYDVRGQVTDAAIAANVFTHAYDGIGNHLLAGVDATTNAIVNNALNQTTAFGGETIAWNVDGDMASDADWNYDYDAEDRLVTTTSRTFTNGALRVRNDYDYRNRRVMKAVDRYDADAGTWNLTERRDFVWDDWNIVHETVSTINGGTTNVSEIQYFWGSDLSGMLQGAGGVGGLLVVSRDGVFYFPVYDNNGNVMKYVDESGTVVADYLYDDFGRTISQSGELADVFSCRFSSKYFDSETSLYYYGYRFFSPVRSRWLNRDPIEERGGLNLYAFCRNSPLASFDTNGLVDWRTNPTRHVKDMGRLNTNGRMSSFPGGAEWTYSGNTLAIASADWDVRVFCKCKTGSSCWSLNYVRVVFTPVVHYREDYQSNELSRWVREKEQDHIADYKWWARNEGKRMVADFERRNLGVVFSDNTTCVSSLQPQVESLLTSSFVTIIRRTVRDWDTPGSHTRQP